MLGYPKYERVDELKGCLVSLIENSIDSLNGIHWVEYPGNVKE